MSDSRSISLLVPSYNRLHALELIWETWLAQTGLREIVLVDDGSTQDYAPFVATLTKAAATKNVRVCYIRHDSRRGAPASRNSGLSECTGDYILTTDDDIQLAPDMTALLMQVANQNYPRTIPGARVIYPKDGEQYKAAKARSDADKRDYFRLPQVLLNPSVNPGKNVRSPTVTAVALWPRDLFTKGLRWHEGYGGNGYREETDPQLVAQAKFGAAPWYVPSAECYHLPPSKAYIGNSGQRRGGALWFEYWVLRNNLLFWSRHGAYLSGQWGVPAWKGVASLAMTRFNPRRVISLVSALLRRRANGRPASA